jgi:hypothetical protein
MNIYPMALNTYPIIITPADTSPINVHKSLGFITCFNIIMDGNERAVTPIIKVKTVPNPTPLL